MNVLLRKPVMRFALSSFHAPRIMAVQILQYSTKPKETNHYDIIIGGGGLVGTALAAALNKNRMLEEKRILLLEGAPPFKGFDHNAQYGNRVSAINNNTIELFKMLEIWQNMLDKRIKPVKQMQVWDASSDALIQFQHDYFAEDIACIAENDLMLSEFYGLLEKADNVEVRNNARIEQVKLPAESSRQIATVQLKDGEIFTSELLIGADGANSLVRKAMGVDVYSINYERMGLVATLDVQDAGNNAVAWQRFLPNGPLALLPLNDKMSSLVWSTTQNHAKELLSMSSDNFINAINEGFCKEFPKDDFTSTALNGLNALMGRNTTLRQYPPRVTGVVEKSRATFPLGFLHCSAYVGTGTAIIGDAAHRIHPMAGQGVNLGFSDVRFLVDALADAVGSGAKLNDLHYLLKYESKCLAKNVPILVGVHGLQSLYSTTFSPVVFLRSVGLQLTDNLPFIKDMFMRRAIG